MKNHPVMGQSVYHKVLGARAEIVSIVPSEHEIEISVKYPDGVITALKSHDFYEAIILDADDELTIDGDLNQMAIQKDFLSNMGFDLRMASVYPIVAKENVISALTLIWTNRVSGWWHYKKEYVKYGICSYNDFEVRLANE